ncbi:MAG: ATP-binding protein [Spirochaetaceae bacterium]
MSAPHARAEGAPDMSRFRELFTGSVPPYLQRFVKGVGRTVNKFDMIPAGSSTLLSISGGKDSLVLALALSLRRRWMPVSYELTAAMVEWREHPLSDLQRAALEEYFDAIRVPFKTIRASMFPESFHGKFNCYLCARNRKRVLFDELRETGVNRIAVGHHLDDIAETTLINISMRGSFSTMMPVQPFFGGKVTMIRPMAETPEEKVLSVHEQLQLPAVTIDCPYRKTNIRSNLKPIIRELSRLNKRARQNIFRAGWNIDHEYVPGLASDAD